MAEGIYGLQSAQPGGGPGRPASASPSDLLARVNAEESGVRARAQLHFDRLLAPVAHDRDVDRVAGTRL